MRIDISICPTNLESGTDGEIMDSDLYLAAIEELVATEYPDAWVETQIGYRQGDEWFRIDGDEDDALLALVLSLDTSDESLYV